MHENEACMTSKSAILRVSVIKAHLLLYESVGRGGGANSPGLAHYLYAIICDNLAQ